MVLHFLNLRISHSFITSLMSERNPFQLQLKGGSVEEDETLADLGRHLPTREQSGSGKPSRKCSKPSPSGIPLRAEEDEDKHMGEKPKGTRGPSGRPSRPSGRPTGEKAKNGPPVV